MNRDKETRGDEGSSEGATALTSTNVHQDATDRVSRPSLKVLQMRNSDLLTSFYNSCKQVQRALDQSSNITEAQLNGLQSQLDQAQNLLTYSNDDLAAFYERDGATYEAEDQRRLSTSTTKNYADIIAKIESKRYELRRDCNTSVTSSSSKKIELEEKLNIAKIKAASQEKTFQLEQKRAELAKQVREIDETTAKVRSNEEIEILKTQLAAEESREQLSLGVPSLDSDSKVNEWVRKTSELSTDPGCKPFKDVEVLQGHDIYPKLPIVNPVSGTVPKTVQSCLPGNRHKYLPAKPNPDSRRRVTINPHTDVRKIYAQSSSDCTSDSDHNQYTDEGIVSYQENPEPNDYHSVAASATKDTRRDCEHREPPHNQVKCSSSGYQYDKRREQTNDYQRPNSNSSRQRDASPSARSHGVHYRDGSRHEQEMRGFIPQHFDRPRSYSEFTPQYQETNRPRYRDYEWMDRSTLHFALLDLKRPPTEPFAGQPYLYHTWIKNLTSNMDKLKLPASDRIEVLEGHTKGEAYKVIQTFKTAFGYKPEVALKVILDKLHKRFGSDTEIAHQMREKIRSFPEIRGKDGDPNVAFGLRELSDICIIINAQMSEIDELKEFDFPSGLEVIRKKLPDFINSQWRKTKADYKERCGFHPRFSHFSEFLEKRAEALCMDVPPKFQDEKRTSGETKSSQKQTFVLQTSVQETEIPKCEAQPDTLPQGSSYNCPLHRTNSHKLSDCMSFVKMQFPEKKLLVNALSLCFKCLGNHKVSNCNIGVTCDICKNTNHVTIMHATKKNFRDNNSKERNSDNRKVQTSLCTSSNCGGKSCSKTLLADIYLPDGSKSVRSYVIVDEQSTSSFISPRLLDLLGVDSIIENYSINTLSGLQSTIIGRTVAGLMIRGVNEVQTYKLPKLYENNFIPDTKSEVALPEHVKNNSATKQYHTFFQPIDDDAEVHVLIGRDSGLLMTTEVKNSGIPVVHKTPLGWACVGNFCYDQNNSRNSMTILRTSLCEHFHCEPEFQSTIFDKRADDEVEGLSVEDKKFNSLMDENCHVNEEGNIEFPLPLRNEAVRMPSNKRLILHRQTNTLSRLAKDPHKLRASLDCMQAFIDAKHVELVPFHEIEATKGKLWFLPVFPVVQEKKNKTRLVFDSAAACRGISLNSSLLSGPDQNNKLRGVLTRFREEEIGFVADIQAMFHSFRVNTEHRDLMRFFWHNNNDPNEPLVQYRCRVHIFGNTSSPAVATRGLRRAADSLLHDPSQANVAAWDYIHRGFYVDDGLGCSATSEAAINILSAARKALSNYKINLHKIVSNSQTVLDAFPISDRAITNLDFNQDDHPRTLGVSWDVTRDEFIIKVSLPERPFTKRGILSTINTIFDPIGFTTPIVLGGKLFQRKIIPRKEDVNDTFQKYGWDDPLPLQYLTVWQSWKSSLKDLSDLKVSRCFKPKDFGPSVRTTAHVFCDASENAIATVIYLCLENEHRDFHVTFLYGESKVSPRGATTIPRMELCAAANSCISSKKVLTELSINIDATFFYSDSSVTLGYISNHKKRFSRYVARRIEIIHSVSDCKQWRYVTTDENPADVATRITNVQDLRNSTWFTGPEFLRTKEKLEPLHQNTTDELPEIDNSDFLALATSMSPSSVFDCLFEKSHDWMKLRRIVSHVVSFIGSFKRKSNIDSKFESLTVLETSTFLIIRDAQRSCFGYKLLENLRDGIVPSDSSLSALAPFSSAEDIVRVGGRLKLSSLPLNTKHPIILPRNHPVSISILKHHHEKVNHQGRVITHGALRTAGYYLQCGSKVIKKFINDCFVCRRLRAKPAYQFMAELPKERTEYSPPFTNIGLDVMGPWLIHDGKTTRRTTSTKKMWAVLFTCFYSRAVHVEPLPHMDTSSFKNALRRFLALRGPCRTIRCDRGTNLVAASKEEINLSEISTEMDIEDCKWTFNTPHSPHFGGSWERKVGQIKRCLDEAIMKATPHGMSRDELHTLLSEAANIVNGTPLWDASYDPNEPFPLCPNNLLTMKAWDPLVENSSSTDSTCYGKRRWRRVQFISQQFWTSYQKSYLQTLQKRQKWLHKTCVEMGDVVLLHEDNSKRNYWPVALVDGVKQSADGLVRSATVSIVKSLPTGFKRYTYERPVHKMSILCKANKK